MAATSRQWFLLISQDSRLWRELYSAHWGTAVVGEEVGGWLGVYRGEWGRERLIRRSAAPLTTAIGLAVEQAYGLHPDEPSPSHAHYHSQDPREPIRTVTVHSLPSHWHYISWGLSQVEGTGVVPVGRIELSFRLGKSAEEEEWEARQAPEWPVPFLHSLGRYVSRSGNVFGNGDHMHLSKPLGGEESLITALLFRHDPVLKNRWRNPTGPFSFIQIIGVTADELEVAVGWNKLSFLGVLSKHWNNPLLITHLQRPSILSDSSVALLLSSKTKEEGSAQGLLFVEHMRYEERDGSIVLFLPPGVIPDLKKMIRGRLPFRRGFFLVNSVNAFTVKFSPLSSVPQRFQGCSSWSLEQKPSQLHLFLSSELAQQLEEIVPQVGQHSFHGLDRFTLEIVKK